ncbi:BLUF domain-containing protein [Curtobacterium sp. 1P10AnD]|uniref:BLUF domain-containing protein n=1 Tax=Curtobacterium sp. 1P10AnD TaxID=3132283 RepID=UPI0039A3B744
MTLSTLVFTAARTGRLSHDDLVRLLPVERARNAELGITGVLALDDANVLGVVEGPDDVVRARVHEVASDPANVDVQVLLDDPIEERTFPDWSMAFRTDDPAVRSMDGFEDLFAEDRAPDPAADTSRSRALLEWFRRTPPEQLSTRRSTAPVRERVLRASIDVLRDVGPTRSSLDAVAERAGLPRDTVTANFPTMPALLAATLATWLDQVTAPLAPVARAEGTVPWLRALVVAFAAEPALDRLIVAALAPAADPGEPAGGDFLVSYRAFRDGIRLALEQDVAVGRLPATLDPGVGAQQLLALFDGLRIQNLFDPEPDVAETFARAADRLRRGWAAS